MVFPAVSRVIPELDNPKRESIVSVAALLEIVSTVNPVGGFNMPVVEAEA